MKNDTKNGGSNVQNLRTADLNTRVKTSFSEESTNRRATSSEISTEKRAPSTGAYWGCFVLGVAGGVLIGGLALIGALFLVSWWYR